jgi:hypothetical protein
MWVGRSRWLDAARVNVDAGAMFSVGCAVFRERGVAWFGSGLRSPPSWGRFEEGSIEGFLRSHRPRIHLRWQALVYMDIAVSENECQGSGGGFSHTGRDL